MNQEDVRVSFYLKKSEADEQGEQGECPIMGRLNVGKYSEAAFSVKMTAPESAWLSGRATGKSARSREINRQLDEIRASALSIYQDLFALWEKVSAEEVKCILVGHGLRAGNIGGVLPPFHKEIREESRSQSRGRHGYILQVCL